MSRKAGALTNVAASVHQRLLNLSHLRQRPFNEVVQYYAMERFLARLVRTPYADQLILKGALALRTWADADTRATRDIDFMGNATLRSTPSTIDAVAQIVAACAGASAAPDGVHFDDTSITVVPITAQTDDAGVRATFRGTLGTVRLAMQVDVGIGDAIEPPAVWVAFPQLLAPEPIRVLAYTLETIIAEKFHAIATRDLANTRMKDFFDLWTIGRIQRPEPAALATAIAATFRRRATPVPDTLPVGLTSRFVADAPKMAQWKAFWRRAGVAGEPPPLFDVAAEIGAWVMPACAGLRMRDHDA